MMQHKRNRFASLGSMKWAIPEPVLRIQTPKCWENYTHSRRNGSDRQLLGQENNTCNRGHLSSFESSSNRDEDPVYRREPSHCPIGDDTCALRDDESAVPTEQDCKFDI